MKSTIEIDALRDLETWCANERAKLGAIDGYDYRSGEEFGIRRVERQIAKVIASTVTSQERREDQP